MSIDAIYTHGEISFEFVIIKFTTAASEVQQKYHIFLYSLYLPTFNNIWDSGEMRYEALSIQCP